MFLAPKIKPRPLSASEMADVESRLSRAKATLMLEQPFFSTLLWRLSLRADESLDTMATDGKQIAYSPRFVLFLQHPELVFVLCHEVMHCALLHCLRRAMRSPGRWNRACDYIVNDILVQERVGTPPARLKILHDSALVAAGRGTAEGVYALLPEEEEGGGGDRPGQDVLDTPGDAAAREHAEGEWKVAVSQAANAAQACGRLGGGLKRFVDRVLKPRVAWEDVLRKFVSARATVETTFARLNRRWLWADLLLPSKGGTNLGRMVFAIDTSGSIRSEELDQAWAEVLAVHQDMRPSALDVIYWDSCVRGHATFGPDDIPEISACGGGGTVFSPVLAHIEEHEIEPVCMVVLTDLCIYDFGEPPDYPVLWISTTADHAPWGEVVKLSP